MSLRSIPSRRLQGSLSNLSGPLLQWGVLRTSDLGKGDENHGQLLLVDAAVVIEVTLLQKDRLAFLDVLRVVVLTTGIKGRLFIAIRFYYHENLATTHSKM